MHHSDERGKGDGRGPGRTRWHPGRSLLAILGAVLVGGCVLLGGSEEVSGRGTVAGHLSCLAVNMNSGGAAGRSFAIGYWPPGYTAKRVPGASPNGVLLDGDGATVLREGDMVDVHLRVTNSSGDTPCDTTEVVTVLDFTPVPSSGSSTSTTGP